MSMYSLKKGQKRVSRIADYEFASEGSHDFSPSGRTMVEVLEKAGLLKNVCQGQIENNTLTRIELINKSILFSENDNNSLNLIKLKGSEKFGYISSVIMKLSYLFTTTKQL